MFDLGNKNEISGMFSKAGRVSYERYHILQKKGDILYEQDKPKVVSQFISVIDKMVTAIIMFL